MFPLILLILPLSIQLINCQCPPLIPSNNLLISPLRFPSNQLVSPLDSSGQLSIQLSSRQVIGRFDIQLWLGNQSDPYLLPFCGWNHSIVSTDSSICTTNISLVGNYADWIRCSTTTISNNQLISNFQIHLQWWDSIGNITRLSSTLANWKVIADWNIISELSIPLNIPLFSDTNVTLSSLLVSPLPGNVLSIELQFWLTLPCIGLNTTTLNIDLSDNTIPTITSLCITSPLESTKCSNNPTVEIPQCLTNYVKFKVVVILIPSSCSIDGNYTFSTTSRLPLSTSAFLENTPNLCSLGDVNANVGGSLSSSSVSMGDDLIFKGSLKPNGLPISSIVLKEAIYINTSPQHISRRNLKQTLPQNISKRDLKQRVDCNGNVNGEDGLSGTGSGGGGGGQNGKPGNGASGLSIFSPSILSPHAYSIYFDKSKKKIITVNGLTNDFTVAFWIKTKQNGTNNYDWPWTVGLIDGEITGYVDDWGISLLLSGGIVCGQGWYERGYDISVKSKRIINDDDWHWIVCSRNSSGYLQLFIDGISQGFVVGSSRTRTNTEFVIGASKMGNYFQGYLSNIQFFNRVLTKDEMDSYSLGSSISPSFIQREIWMENQGSLIYGNVTGRDYNNQPLLFTSYLFSSSITENVPVIAIGGGGAGGYFGGNGGSSGLLLSTTLPSIQNLDYKIVIGKGGIAPTCQSCPIGNGEDSIIDNLIAKGGKGGSNGLSTTWSYQGSYYYNSTGNGGDGITEKGGMAIFGKSGNGGKGAIVNGIHLGSGGSGGTVLGYSGNVDFGGGKGGEALQPVLCKFSFSSSTTTTTTTMTTTTKLGVEATQTIPNPRGIQFKGQDVKYALDLFDSNGNPTAFGSKAGINMGWDNGISSSGPLSLKLTTPTTDILLNYTLKLKTFVGDDLLNGFATLEDVGKPIGVGLRLVFETYYDVLAKRDYVVGVKRGISFGKSFEVETSIHWNKDDGVKVKEVNVGNGNSSVVVGVSVAIGFVLLCCIVGLSVFILRKKKEKKRKSRDDGSNTGSLNSRKSLVK